MIKSRKSASRKEDRAKQYDGHDVVVAWIQTRDSCREAGKAIGVCAGTISNWLSGFRRPSLEMCMRVEEITEGAFKVKDMRPDLIGGWRK